MYKAQICYFDKIENNIKEIVYFSTSNDHAINDAIMFANEYIKTIKNAVITKLKIFLFSIPIIVNGNLIEDKGKTLFSWDSKNAKAIKDHLKKLQDIPNPPDTMYDA